MTDIIEQAAKAMFESVHSYHPDLNWDNAYQSHKDFYLKLARVADPVFNKHYNITYHLIKDDED